MFNLYISEIFIKGNNRSLNIGNAHGISLLYEWAFFKNLVKHFHFCLSTKEKVKLELFFSKIYNSADLLTDF